jgi:WD40 repeat protein
VRPERPDDEDAPQLSDAIWELAMACWVKEPRDRPTALALCTIVSHLLETTPVTRPTQDASPGLSLETLSIDLPTPNTSHVRSSTPTSTLIIRGYTDTVSCTAFSLDGKKIASGSKGGTIRVWGAQTGNHLLGPLEIHTEWVKCVTFSPNGTQIASGSSDSSILVWNAVTGKVIAGPFRGHTSYIVSLCFSPDGQKIASASWDKTIRIWNARTGTLLAGPLRGHTQELTSVAFSGDGKKIASGSHDKTIRVWDAKSGRLVRGPMVHNEPVFFVEFSPDSKRIVSASRHGDVCVWNADTGTLVSGPSLRHTEGSLAVAFTPTHTCSSVSSDGKWIAARDQNCITVHVWNSKTGQLAVSFEGHTDIIHSLSFSPDSKRILSASFDNTIHVHTLDC